MGPDVAKQKTGALVFTVGADTRPLARNLKKAQGMVTGFGAGMGRIGAGLGKVGLGATAALGATVLAMRGAFRALMGLAPYSDDLATALGEMINVQENLKRRVADALVPAVDTLSKAMNDAAPTIADAAVGMTEGLAAYLDFVSQLSRPGQMQGVAGGFFDQFTAGMAGLWNRYVMGEERAADQSSVEMYGHGSWFWGTPDATYGAGEAGTDLLGRGARGEGRAGEYRELLESIANNTSDRGGEF